MIYEDACEATVTREAALQEIARHDLGDPEPAQLFLQEVGDRATYTGKEVLDWLGY